MDEGTVNSAMMLPPDDNPTPLDGPIYDLSRGACPRCGSRDVIHLLIGMLADPMSAHEPDWLVPVGGVHPGYERECRECGFGWTPGADGKGMMLRDLSDLMCLSESADAEEFEEWLNSRVDLDASIEWDDLQPVVRMHDSGVGLGFPMTLDEFWDAVYDLQKDVLERLEEDGGPGLAP